jgi:hypothetical protein
MLGMPVDGIGKSLSILCHPYCQEELWISRYGYGAFHSFRYLGVVRVGHLTKTGSILDFL